MTNKKPAIVNISLFSLVGSCINLINAVKGAVKTHLII